MQIRNVMIGLVLILTLSVPAGCKSNGMGLETMWYKNNSGYHELHDPDQIEEIKDLLNQIEWKGTEPGSLTGEPDFAFWIGRDEDNIRTIHCNVWKLDSEHWGITKMGEEFDILNRYSQMTQTDLDQIFGILEVNATEI